MSTEAAKSKSTPAFFPRSALAAVIANQVLDTSQGLTGGTFLAAPRRTGKSTFIRQDLVPELQSRNVEVIYVDLWADKAVNPAIHIANALHAALSKSAGTVAKLARKLAGLSQINLGAFGSGLRFDLSQLNMPKDATLGDALKVKTSDRTIPGNRQICRAADPRGRLTRRGRCSTCRLFPLRFLIPAPR